MVFKPAFFHTVPTFPLPLLTLGFNVNRLHAVQSSTMSVSASHEIHLLLCSIANLLILQRSTRPITILRTSPSLKPQQIVTFLTLTRLKPHAQLLCIRDVPVPIWAPANARTELKILYGHFLPNPFQLIISHLSQHRCYIVLVMSKNKLSTNQTPQAGEPPLDRCPGPLILYIH
jgi:hypothetical protein